MDDNFPPSFYRSTIRMISRRMYVNDIIEDIADLNILSINAIWILLSIDLQNMYVNYTNIFITFKLA